MLRWFLLVFGLLFFCLVFEAPDHQFVHISFGESSSFQLKYRHLAPSMLGVCFYLIAILCLIPLDSALKIFVLIYMSHLSRRLGRKEVVVEFTISIIGLGLLCLRLVLLYH